MCKQIHVFTHQTRMLNFTSVETLVRRGDNVCITALYLFHKVCMYIKPYLNRSGFVENMSEVWCVFHFTI